jgi:hypothetical protein
MSSLDHVWQERRPETGTPAEVTENVVQARLEPRHRRHGWFHLAVVGTAFGLAAVVLTWLGLHRSDGPAPAMGAPVLVSQAQLEQLAGRVSHPVYWAGPKSGYSYELTITSGTRIYVRYLPQGTKAGDRRPNFLVVGTYPQPGAFAALKRASKQPGSVSVGIDNGGLVVFSSARPTSVYFSHPGSNYQVEVYSPSGNAARSLVLGGKITPIRPAR